MHRLSSGAATAVAALFLAACGSTMPTRDSTAAAPADDRASDSQPRAATPIADQYRDVAAQIIAAALTDKQGWERLTHMTDQIGHRLSGSAALEQAIAWSVAQMKEDGLDARAEKVMVPHWVRGPESGQITAPIARPLRLLGLGGTIATPRGGLKAEVMVVANLDELKARAAEARGKIVVYNFPMTKVEDDGHDYGDAYTYRSHGASVAAEMGAVGVLVRSLTAKSLGAPHTGGVRYKEEIGPIPAAAITVEDAELLHRLSKGGKPVTVQMSLGAKTLPDAESANVVAELRGSEKPEEIVLLGAHIDSWDVGQGAHDDAGGCVMAMQALALIKRLGLKPRRTIRVVLFTNEENGLRGGFQYTADHKDELVNHIMAIETDFGVFQPLGISVENSPAALARMTDITSLLEPVGAAMAKEGGSGADLIPLVEAGVIGMGLVNDGGDYFDYHHSEADTLDKIDPEDLAKSTAALAVVAFVVADMPDRVGDPTGAVGAAATPH